MTKNLEPELLDACWNGKLEKVERLVNKGAYLEWTNEFGETPLVRAAARGHADVVEFLLECGADPNAQSRNGNTALIWAVRLSHDAAAEMLLYCDDTATNLSNDDGNTALIYAAVGNNNDIVARLLAHGADPKHRNRKNISALTWARNHGNTRMESLLQNAADTVVDAPQPDPAWRKTGEHEISYTHDVAGRSLTEVFNFETRERITFSTNTATKAETLFREGFDAIADKTILKKAAEKLVRRGGSVPGNKPVDKQKVSVKIG